MIDPQQTCRAPIRIVVGCSRRKMKKILERYIPKDSIEDIIDLFEYRNRKEFDFISVFELTWMLNVSWRTVYSWVEKGWLPSIKIGRRYFMDSKVLAKVFNISKKELDERHKFWKEFICESVALRRGKSLLSD